MDASDFKMSGNGESPPGEVPATQLEEMDEGQDSVDPWAETQVDPFAETQLPEQELDLNPRQEISGKALDDQSLWVDPEAPTQIPPMSPDQGEALAEPAEGPSDSSGNEGRAEPSNDDDDNDGGGEPVRRLNLEELESTVDSNRDDNDRASRSESKLGSRSGSINRSRSGSKNRSRSGSMNRSRSGSKNRSRSRSGSRSRLRPRSRSGSGSRSRSMSGSRHGSRRSRSGSSRSSRSRSGSRSRSASKSRSRTRSKSRSRSKSPHSAASRSRSRSASLSSAPSRSVSRSRSRSKSGSRSRSKSGSRSRSRSKSGSRSRSRSASTSGSRSRSVGDEDGGKGSKAKKRAVKEAFGESSDSNDDEAGGQKSGKTSKMTKKVKKATIVNSDGEEEAVEEEEETRPGSAGEANVEKADEGKKDDQDSDDDEGPSAGGGGDGFVCDFDRIMEQKKAEQRRMRRRNRKDIDLINDNDDAIAKMIADMRLAAREDRELNQARQPATKKLSMLPTVMSQLNKADLQMAFVEANVLSVLTDWLAPMPDRSLPSIPIRKSILNLLTGLHIDDHSRLKESGIGKAVMYLYKHPKELRDHKDIAGRIINEWARPIFNLSTDFRTVSKEERMARDELIEGTKPRSRPGTRSTGHDKEDGDDADASLRPGDPGWCYRARVPTVNNKTYINRPEWTSDVDMSRGKRAKEPNRLDKHLRADRERKQRLKLKRAVDISIEGRKMSL